MFNFGKLLFNTTGILTQKEIMRRCANFGQKFSENVIADGKSVSTTTLGEILNGVIGNKSKKIKFVSEKKDIISILKENLKMPEQSAEQFATRAKALSIPKGFGKKTTIIVPKDLSLEDMVNLAPHELEHALKSTFSLSAKKDNILFHINNFYLKVKQILSISSKSFEEQNTEYNDIARKMQEYLLSIANVGKKGAVGIINQKPTLQGIEKYTKWNISQIRDAIKQDLYKILKIDKIEDCKNYKKNMNKIKVLRKMLKDECNAYNVGGLNERRFYEELGFDMQEKASHSELVSILYKEAYNVLTKEQKHILLNRLKSLFGFKPNLKFEEEYLKTNGTHHMSFEEILDFCSKDLAMTIDIIKSNPTSDVAKYILSCNDKRFEAILGELKAIC